MIRIPSIVSAVSFWVATLTTAASDNYFNSLVSYDDGRAARFLQSKGTDCASTARVQCVLRGTNGLPCENNMRVKRSDCKLMGNNIPVRIKIRWTYCNTDTKPQTQYGSKIFAKYKKDKLGEDDLNLSQIPARKCRTYRKNKKLNYCEIGAALSLKYEGTITSRDSSYCFAFNFLRVRKEWLPEDKGACGTTTEIRCKVRGGDKDGEDCAGNIVLKKSGPCEIIDVKFQYQYCNWNPTEGTNIMFDRKNTWIKLRDVKHWPMSRIVLKPEEKCRIKVVNSTISTCDSDTIAEMKVRGTVTGGGNQTCGSDSTLIVVPTEKCDYKFIMTEIVADRANKGSFIEIYSPECANKIITDDFQLVKYVGGTGKPRSDITNLKGLKIDENGFITFCFSSKGNELYGAGKCNYITGYESPADNAQGYSIAIIEGKIDGDYIIHDAFGNITKGELGPIQDLKKNRAVRRKIRVNPRSPYNANDWRIRGPENIDPGAWHDKGPRPITVTDPSTVTDCKSAKDIKATTTSNSGSKSPKESKTPNPSNSGSKSPKENNTFNPDNKSSSSTKQSKPPNASKGGSSKRGSGPPKESKCPKESKYPKESEPPKESNPPKESKPPN